MNQKETAVGTAANINKTGLNEDSNFSLLNGKEPLFNAANQLLKKGFSVGIVNRDKHPVVNTWKKYQTIPATPEEIVDQLMNPNAFGLGVYTGYDGFEAIDLDLKYDLTDTLEQRLEDEIERRCPGLLDRCAKVKTRSGGKHYYYKCQVIEKSQKLAKRPTTEEEKRINPKEKFKSLIETRGIGGLVVTAPTPEYTSIRKCDPPLLTIEERDIILSACRSFNEVFEDVAESYRSTDPSDAFEVTPWDDYNQRGVDDMLQRLDNAGWKQDARFGNKIRFTRPGKSSGTSAEWDSEKGKFYVFTSSSEFDNEHGYQPATVFKILECGNDASKSSKELEALGYGKRNPKKEKEKKTERQPSVEIDSLIEWLHSTYKFRRNETNRRIELEGQEMQQKDFNSVYLGARKVFSKLNYDLLERAINSDYTMNYNPLKDFIQENKHRQPKGNIKELAETIKTDTGFAVFPDYVFHFVCKWYVSIIASIYGEHSSLMLVLCGSKQGTGKTEWFRRLLPTALKNFYGESKLDAGKDDEILMCQKLLISDDEFGGKSKKDEKRIKEVLSKDYFTLREPYGRHNVDLKRLAVLCGTTNDNEILSDPTGNRRIIPINVLEIDKDAYNQIDKTDLFIEAYHLYKSGFEWRLTSGDISDLNKNTSGFEQTSIERDLLAENFKVPQSEDDPSAVFLTTSRIKSEIEIRSHQRLNLNRLGIELRKMTGMDRASKKINGQSVKGYFLIDRLNLVVSGQ